MQDTFDGETLLEFKASGQGLDHWNLGVLQGRLLPKVSGRYQAFPQSAWAHEIGLCSKFGIRQLELIVDTFVPDSNPLLSEDGVQLISREARGSEVELTSVCVDSFMDSPIFDAESAEVNEALLRRLADSCQALSITTLIIPFVDRSAIRNPKQKLEVLRFLNHRCSFLADMDLNLALETALCPEDFADLLSDTDPSFVNVNYDIGNSASLEFDPHEEFSAYGERITNVHVKDRRANGPSVPLGTGDARLHEVFLLLHEYEFNGTLIAQAWRGDWGALDTVPQLFWLKHRLQAWH